ncbi:chitooligosaccharidolytic beta-N-acetylglucosaminidase-like [Oratosquilla oratoria]|uniref:chitooligosaccharidolytic beta-N-acetylglucosaminidase-like n=1 Tax=Oratosquilla oratoria TaxID=337810 RepID=UPI003F75F5DE
MQQVFVLALSVLVGVHGQNSFQLPAPYSYQCNTGKCQRTPRSEARQYQSLETCKLTCGEYGSIWPQPTGEVTLKKDTSSFKPQHLQVTKLSAPNNRVVSLAKEALRLFERSIHYYHPDFPETEKRVTPQTQDKAKNKISTRNNPFVLRSESLIDEQLQLQRANLRAELNPTTLNEFDPRYDEFQFRTFKDRQFYERSPFNRRLDPVAEDHRVNIEMTITSPEDRFSLNTDESYNLGVATQGQTTTVNINANSYYGARHALETLSQLIAFNDLHNSLQIVNDAKVTDKPAFRYRGIMLDTGRNYYSKEAIMRLVDAMSYNKLNTLHWHISDFASFPMYTPRVPNMVYYGGYGTRQVYYPLDINEIVRYANIRGIQVVPEIDTPAHASNGWQWGEKEGKGKLVLCANQDPWFEYSKEVPAGQLNPVNPEVYNVLGDIYRDVMDVFDSDMFHMGSDDVSYKCWEKSQEITQYLKANNKEPGSPAYLELWNLFQANALTKLEEASGTKQVTPVVYSSTLASKLNKDKYVVQISDSTSQNTISEYIQKGFRVIFSNHDQWNIDCGRSNWMGEKVAKCGNEPVTWRTIYDHSPLDVLAQLGMANARAIYNERSAQPDSISLYDQILGGTTTMYSYETDESNIESRVWPKSSAFAERLWSDPTHNWSVAETRFYSHRERMVNRGVLAEAVRPAYCLQNEDMCYTETQYRQRSEATPAV